MKQILTFILNKSGQKSKEQKGFTLIELLIYMGMLVVLLSVLTGIFASSLDVQLESQANSAVEQDGSYILSRLAYDIHRAEAINIPDIPGSPGDQTDNFQIVVNSVNYSYSIDAGDNLVLANDLGVNNLNGNGTSISNLLVTRLGNTGKIEDNLSISFTITSRARKNTGYETKNFQTNLALRRQ